MPTLLILHGHKYRFYSADGGEPPHIHIVKAAKHAKIWLSPVVIARNNGYSEIELNRILKVVKEHQKDWTEAFNGYFGV